MARRWRLVIGGDRTTSSGADSRQVWSMAPSMLSPVYACPAKVTTGVSRLTSSLRPTPAVQSQRVMLAVSVSSINHVHRTR